MGFSMVDFFLRECRAVVEGDMVVIRLGSCGSLDESLPIGTVIVAGASHAVTRNYDYFVKSEMGALDEESTPYAVSLPLRGDGPLHNALSECLQSTVPSEKHNHDFPAGLLKVQNDVTNGSADSFYGSQGRIDSAFWDENSDWVNELSQKHGIQTLEMETYVLNHLAMCANKRSRQDENDRRLRTGAVQMIFANRHNSAFITPDQVEILEMWSGRAVCDALIQIHIEPRNMHKEGVWTQDA
ncbi:unnamed protein product [Jaminaea pallidilutea]